MNHKSDKGLNPNQQFSPQFFEKSNQDLQRKFRGKFEEQHRQLKAMIHLCQHKAYANSKNIELADSEKAAEECFVPLLMIRRHASVIMKNAEIDFKNCMHDQ